MSTTKIEWATHTSNWLAGCTKVSPACTHCYAESMTRRLASGLGRKMPQYQDGVVDLDTGRWTGRVAYNRLALQRAFDGMINARKPRRVFCNSMSDTFHDDVPPESLTDLAARIEEIAAGLADGTCVPWPHVVMLLTKRPQNLLRWQREHFPDGLPDWVWVGCTVEDQRRAEERADVLHQVRGAVRFLSCEPLVGPLDLRRWLPEVGELGVPTGFGGSIGWVIAGGESGPKARPSHPDWFRSLRDQCVAAGVPFHFKQWGEWSGEPGAIWRRAGGESVIGLTVAGEETDVGGSHLHPYTRMVRLGKKAAGRELDGRTWDEVPA